MLPHVAGRRFCTTGTPSPAILLRDACESGPRPPPTQPRPLLAPLGPDCPTRPVDWRWLKPGMMMELGLRWSRRRDDETDPLGQAISGSLCNAADMKPGDERLDARMPGGGGAYAIPDAGPPQRAVGHRGTAPRRRADPRRSRVQGRPRRGRPSTSYHMFVLQRLGPSSRNRGYLAHEAIGPAAIQGLGHGGAGAFLKLVAYHGGPSALDAAIAATGGDAAPGQPVPPRSVP